MRPKKFASIAAAIAVSIGIAACGDSGASGGVDAAAIDSPEGKEFRSLLGLTDTDLEKLKGETFNLGAVLPLSGNGANYGRDQGNGIELAVEQMRKYVGLDVVYTAKDHKSGDPQAAAQAARDLGIEGHGAVMNSYYGVFGATLPTVQKYKMLSFDPGGGTGNGLKGKDYFWGFRANTPDDPFYGLRYFKRTQPSLKKVTLVIWDAGDAYTGPITEHLEQRIAENDMTFTGAILSKIGATNYSLVLSKLKDAQPDIIVLATYGTDTGHFMKQYVESGLKAQVLGPEYLPDAAKVAGPAFDKYMFGADYFDVDSPPNPLSKFFVKSYEAKFGEPPRTFYAPNYYEATLGYLQLVARVAADGGDINSGDALNEALIADPTLKSVYGGDASTVGEIELDASTHDPTVRPVGLFQAGSKVKQVASWNIGGGDYQILGD